MIHYHFCHKSRCEELRVKSTVSHSSPQCQNVHTFCLFWCAETKVMIVAKLDLRRDLRHWLNKMQPIHTLAYSFWHTNEWWRNGTPEAKHWDVLRNGWEGGSEGQRANLQVGQTGWPLLGAAAGVGADARRHVTVKRVCVPRLGDIVTWGDLSVNTEEWL